LPISAFSGRPLSSAWPLMRRWMLRAKLAMVAGRIGGDEFVVVLPHTTVEEAVAVASRIVDPLAARPHMPLGLSFGVVRVEAGESVDAALHRADQALYEAKRQGRSCAVIATGDNENPVFAESMPLGLMPM